MMRPLERFVSVKFALNFGLHFVAERGAWLVLAEPLSAISFSRPKTDASIDPED